jgi:hypothetical protein
MADHRFAPGNRGRPAGSRNKRTCLVEALMEADADALARKAIEMAKAGDPVMLRLCLDRIAPVRRVRNTVSFALPAVTTAADAVKASAALLGAVASGELTPSEAAELGKLVEAHIKALEATEFEGRLQALEARQPRAI